jgi:hypothetical protein
MAPRLDTGKLIGVDLGPGNSGSRANGHRLGENGLRDGSAAAVYAKKWRAAVESGSGLYVGRSGNSATPLLDNMISQLPRRVPLVGRRLTIVEAAAGGGEQATYLASRVRRANVMAIDTSSDAASQIERRRDAQIKQIRRRRSEVTVVTGDVLDTLKGQKPGSVVAYHGNSFWHFLREDERADQMREMRRVGERGALVAVSVKAIGDGLLSEPGTEIVGKDHRGIYAVPADGIRRLFVTDPGAFAEEFTRSGLRVARIVPFSIPNYDVTGKDGNFLGILARNIA